MDLRYLRENSDVIWQRTLEQLQLSLFAMVLAIPFALLLTVIALRVRPLRFPIQLLVGIAYTIPSLVVMVLLIPSQGIGDRPVIIMLVMYAQFALVRKFVAGMEGVDRTILDAARGVGMSAAGSFWRVQLPLALPVMISGVRIALVTVVGLATFGGLISAGGLGRVLFEGIGRNYPSMVLAGIIAIVALTIAVDVVLRAIEWMTPAARGRRARQG
jgi:osmoprotectant transport system permease protein